MDFINPSHKHTADINTLCLQYIGGGGGGGGDREYIVGHYEYIGEIS